MSTWTKALALDTIGRPLNINNRVETKHGRQQGRVIGKTENRRTMVDVLLDDGSRYSFYGSSLFLI